MTMVTVNLSVLADAREDAKSYGAGWVMVDPQGEMRLVSPPEIRSWLDHVDAQRKQDT